MTDEDIRALIERTLKQDIIRASDRQVGRMDENDPWLIEVATDAREHTEAVLSALRSAGLAVVQDWSTIENAPNADDLDRPEVQVFGGRHRAVTVAKPDGEWWRFNRKQDGATAGAPTHWAPLLPPPSKQDGESQ